VGRMADGLSRQLDRLKGLGNSVVPDIPELIGRAIVAREARLAHAVRFNRPP
jgi:DNA (cytosine-5)-methyltransferase 1